jgi:tRNA A-37 threonylcarbamoyl transferase component Bud32/tetratricopeptide (TPR) repeat protein
VVPPPPPLAGGGPREASGPKAIVAAAASPDAADAMAKAKGLLPETLDAPDDLVNELPPSLPPLVEVRGVVHKSVRQVDPLADADKPTRRQPKLRATGPSADRPVKAGAAKAGAAKAGSGQGVGNQRARITMAESAVIGDIEETSGARVELTVKLNPGEVVPGTRYKIVRWLGEGGMGVVYECVHVDIERRVALKILRPGVSPKSRKAKMFREEARAVSRATAKDMGRGSNIVEVYDFGELPDARMWFAMELLEGQSLARVAGQGTIAASRMIAILRQVCKGLAAAHAAQVIHRDIKPGNIMLVSTGGREDLVKIVDFGVAAMTSGDERQGEQVQLEGTPIYMAPEQAAAAPFDHRLDIYAVGAMAYHVLAGVPPFFGDSVFEILRKVRSDEPTPPSVANPDVDIPAPLEAVILRCLAKDPDDRYTDMRDLEAALCEAQIAAKLSTPWDDLPVPDVDAMRKETILRGMPDRHAFRRKSGGRPWLPYVAAAGVALLGFAGWAALRRSDPAAEELAAAAIDERAAAAREAAARALFIYPPADAPTTRTAYAETVALEKLATEYGKLATARGGELRREFADTLVRLGDTYWEREGGRNFAIDYYIGALVFEPTNEHARERAPITPGELVALRNKAADLSFSAVELTATRTLTALADPDEERRAEKLLEIDQTDESRGVQADLTMKTLLVEEGLVAEAEVVVSDTPRHKNKSRPEDDDDDDDEDFTDPSDEGVRASDRTAAKGLVGQGDAKLRAGDRAEAARLFHRALDRDHRNARALDGLAQISYQEGDNAAAVRYGKRAVAAAPSAAGYRIHLGDAYFKLFRYHEASAQYGKAKALGHAGAAARLQKVEEKLGG